MSLSFLSLLFFFHLFSFSKLIFIGVSLLYNVLVSTVQPSESAICTAAYQAPPSMRFSRQEYWSGVPLPSMIFMLQLIYIRTLLVAQLVKNSLAMWETWVRSLGWEDPLEKGKATHSSILAWRIPGQYSPWGVKELDMTE